MIVEVQPALVKRGFPLLEVCKVYAVVLLVDGNEISTVSLAEQPLRIATMTLKGCFVKA